MEATAKIPLPEFLKVLSSNGIPMKKAMEVTGKMSVEPILLFIHILDDLNPVTRRAIPPPHCHN
jgi:hypothetical protein